MYREVAVVSKIQILVAVVSSADVCSTSRAVSREVHTLACKQLRSCVMHLYSTDPPLLFLTPPEIPSYARLLPNFCPHLLLKTQASRRRKGYRGAQTQCTWHVLTIVLL